jgi:hypothetical protein
MKTEDITITVDTSHIKRAIADCLAPGAVLLPATAVQELFEQLGDTETVEQIYELLVNCGGIRATEMAK